MLLSHISFTQIWAHCDPRLVFGSRESANSWEKLEFIDTTEVRAADLWSEQLAISFSLIKRPPRLSTFYIKSHINREPSVFHQIPFSAYYQQHTAWYRRTFMLKETHTHTHTGPACATEVCLWPVRGWWSGLLHWFITDKEHHVFMQRQTG